MDTDGFLQGFKNPVVRDLVWSVVSPPLLRRQELPPVLPDSRWFIALYEQNHDVFLKADKEPQALLDKVQNRQRIPLGIYFQRLWTYFLSCQKTYQLVLSGQPVFEGTKTIGEFDFVVWDPVEKVHEHWEIASKFYLSVGGTHELTHCYGPNPEDRLDSKFRRLVERQCQLSETPAGKIFLEKLGIKIHRTRILLKGRLFYYGEDAPYPKLADPEHSKGWWMTEEQASRLCGERQCMWTLLRKHQWLAPLERPDDLMEWNDFACKLAQESEQGRPIAVAVFEGEKETSRGFIVPQHWLDQLDISIHS
ncbi:MAG: DUF1853 family protein [Verrucomicrobiales bacterium]